MNKRIMVKKRGGAGVTWHYKIWNKQWGKFVYDDWMLKTFKPVVLNKKAVYRFEIRNMEQQYKQFHIFI